MAYKNVDIDIELDDAIEFIESATASELEAIGNSLKEAYERKDLEGFEVFTSAQYMKVYVNTAIDELAFQRLQDLVEQYGIDTIVNKLIQA